MPEFGTDLWLQALKDELNASETYARAAREWEGDFYFIVSPDGDLRQPRYLYMDLWHGECRRARLVDDPAEENPAFRMKASPQVWKKVVTRQLDPIQGLMTRQIHLQGNMMLVMRNVKAAQELVECVTRVPTQFPDWVPAD